MLELIDRAYPSLRKDLIKPLSKKINPNTVSFFAFIFAVLAGLCFYYGFYNPLYYGLAAIFILLNGYLDLIDNEAAKKYGKSKYSDFLDHSLDRLSDIAIFLGIVMNPMMPMEIGFMTLVMILLVSYLGAEAQAMTKKRIIGGLACRADRLIIIAAMGFLAVASRFMIVWGTLLILILAVFAFVERSYRIKGALI